jgi:BTB/POZ domain
MSNADVILQSTNLVNFRVHKSVLVISSPLFRDMFSLPQPPNDETVDGLPVVHLPEDAEILNSLISMLYPVPPEIPDADSVLALLAASQKYDMVAIQSSIRAEVSRKGLLSPEGADAFRVYAIACRKRLIPEMETTARLTLDYPMTFEYLGEVLRLFEGWALRDLANFRQRCLDRLNSCIQSFLDCRNGPSKIWVGCPGHLPISGASQPENDPVFPPTWLRYFLWGLGPLGVLSTQALNPSHFRKQYLEALHAHVNEKDCHFCMKVHTLQGEAFLAEFEKEMVQARNVQYSFFAGIPYEPERRSQFVSIHRSSIGPGANSFWRLGTGDCRSCLSLSITVTLEVEFEELIGDGEGSRVDVLRSANEFVQAFLVMSRLERAQLLNMCRWEISWG